MKKMKRTLEFYFEYYVGYFLQNSNSRSWSEYMIIKYPERFPREVKYLKELQRDL